MGIEGGYGSEDTVPPEEPRSKVEQPDSGQAETRQAVESQDEDRGEQSAPASGTPRADSKAVAAGEKELEDKPESESVQEVKASTYDGPFESQEAEFEARRASREYAASCEAGSAQDVETGRPGMGLLLERPPNQAETPTDGSQDVAESSGDGCGPPGEGIRAEALDGPGDEQDDGWRQHAEQMQAKWEDHETRWPADAPQEDDGPGDGDGPPGEGTQADASDGSGDEPGSWRGDGGQYLNHEENYAVTRACDRVGAEEPTVTDSLSGHETEVEGANLVGLEYRVKGEDRFKEKVAEQLAAELREDPRGAADSIPDALRYTYQLPKENYAQGYNEITDRLKDDGYEMVFSRNTWDAPGYKGINTRWRTPEGQLFEVQFHTPESFEAKQLTHGAYERVRNPRTNPGEVEELRDFQEKVSAGIPIPEGVADIPNYRREDY